MRLSDLHGKSILVLGYGVEGIATFKVLRKMFPRQRVGVIDRTDIANLLPEGKELLTTDSNIILSYNFGRDYLSFLDRYDVVVKSPGIRDDLPELVRAIERGALITSHTDLFLNSCAGTIVGVTGTKGKGTTSKLIHSMLLAGGIDAHLVGNIGNPPLPLLESTTDKTVFVYEMSSQQLTGATGSPHVAVCLKIVPDHLDFHGDFAAYVAAKMNLVRFQTSEDYFVFNPAFDKSVGFAENTSARKITFSPINDVLADCRIENGLIVYGEGKQKEIIISVGDALTSVEGSFNLNNILPAISVGKIFDLSPTQITTGISNFQPLANRFENIGTFGGITFYNASISTVPEVTIEHIASLGGDVETLLLGGFDRGIDFASLGEEIIRRGIKNLILFPTTGEKIRREVVKAFEICGGEHDLPKMFMLEALSGSEAMTEAVRIAYEKTSMGKICLHSPASPSFGLYRDFHQRGNMFKQIVSNYSSEKAKNSADEQISVE